MGQDLNGSLGSWVTLSDPFPALNEGVTDDESGKSTEEKDVTGVEAASQRQRDRGWRRETRSE